MRGSGRPRSGVRLDTRHWRSKILPRPTTTKLEVHAHTHMHTRTHIRADRLTGALTHAHARVHTCTHVCTGDGDDEDSAKHGQLLYAVGDAARAGGTDIAAFEKELAELVGCADRCTHVRGHGCRRVKGMHTDMGVDMVATPCRTAWRQHWV